MKKRMTAALIAGILIAVGLLPAYAANKKAAFSTDRKLIRRIYEGGLLEVQLGWLAQKNTLTPEVKQFGAMMIRDYGRADRELMALARKKDIEVPSELNIPDKTTKNKLSVLTGTVFDKEYMTEMITLHTRYVSDFSAAVHKANAPELKKWMRTVLPMVQRHLRAAKILAGKLGVDIKAAERTGKKESLQDQKEIKYLP